MPRTQAATEIVEPAIKSFLLDLSVRYPAMRLEMMSGRLK